jgi:hypothetical protein
VAQTTHVHIPPDIFTMMKVLERDWPSQLEALQQSGVPLNAQTTANADAILQNDYIGPVREMLNQKAILMFNADNPDDDSGSQIPSSSDGQQEFRGLSRESETLEFAGRQYVIPAHTSRNEGGGAIDEGGTIPVAGQQGYTDMMDSLRHNLWSIELTRFAIELSNRNEGAFLKLLEAETKGAVADCRKDINRQAYGNQTGTLAAVTADGANTVTVDTVQYLRINMRIDLINSTNDAVLASNRTISAINDTTKVVTYSGADVAGTTDHRLCRTGSWKKEIHGLGDLINNTGTIHGVDSSLAANKWHRSQVIDAGGFAFSEDQGQQMIDNIDVTGNSEVEFIVTTHGIVRRYSNQLKALKQFTDRQSVTLRGGFKALLFNEMPMLKDPDAPKGVMWFLNADALMWAYLPDGDRPGNWKWVDLDGAVLTRKADRTDAFEGYLAADHNLNAPKRQALGRMNNLEDDAAVSGS